MRYIQRLVSFYIVQTITASVGSRPLPFTDKDSRPPPICLKVWAVCYGETVSSTACSKERQEDEAPVYITELLLQMCSTEQQKQAREFVCYAMISLTFLWRTVFYNRKKSIFWKDTPCCLNYKVYYTYNNELITLRLSHLSDCLSHGW